MDLHEPPPLGWNALDVVQHVIQPTRQQVTASWDDRQAGRQGGAQMAAQPRQYGLTRPTGTACRAATKRRLGLTCYGTFEEGPGRRFSVRLGAGGGCGSGAPRGGR